MNDEEKQLDRLLGKWSAGERADARQIERLTQRIQTAWDAKDSPDPQYDAPAETRLAGGAAWRTPALWFSLGVAATVLIAASLFPWSRVRDPEVLPNGSGEPSVLAQIDAGQLVNRATLFRELDDFYVGDLAWMAEVDGRVVLRVGGSKTSGGDSSPATSREPVQALTVKVVVVARAAKGESWKPVWKADLIAENDQLVEVGSPDGAKHDLAIWAHVLPDGSVALDTRLSMDRKQKEAWTYSGVQRPNMPETILTRKSGQVEYRVFQTVAVLPEKVG